MAGISISLLADVRDWLRGAKQASQGVEDISDSLDDLARDAKSSARKMGDELGDETKDGARDATNSLDRVEDSFRDLAVSARRETGEASDALARNTKEGTSRAKRDLEELGNEAKQNAAETFSSFDGSAESFADGLQGTLGGVVSGLGPIGAALGAAGALGIGLIMAELDRGTERSEEFRASVSELAAEYIETGKVGAASLDFILDRMKALATETGEGKTNLSDLYDVAKKSGSSFEDLADAYAGNTEQIDEMLDAGKEYLKQLEEQDNKNVSRTRSGKQVNKTMEEQTEAQRDYNAYLEEAKTKADEAAAAQEHYAQAGGPEMEAKAEAIGSIQDAVDDAAGSWEDYQDKETGAVDPSAYLAGLQARISAANEYAGNLEAAQARLSPEAYQYLVDQGIDFAPMLAAILAGGDEMINNFNSTFTTAAEAGKSAVENTLPDEFDVTAKVDADTTEAETKTTATEKKDRSTTVKAKADTKDAEAKLDEVVAKTRVATIGTAADTTGASNTLYNFMNQSRTVTVTAVVVDRNGKKID
ncbi:hypothetical protein KXS11_03445 [Plantibacter flavus]|uniref:hypothetical protein n=1 Tax=Plantibacter flavus TaxID=150123 RepID=UPI003F158784